MSAVAIVGRGLSREIDVAKLIVSREGTHHADVAGVIGRSVQPGLVSRFSLAWDGMEDPKLLAGAHVEGHDVALDVLLVRARATLCERGTDDDHAVRYHRRRAVADLADRIDGAGQIQLREQVDRPVFAELANRSAG